MIANHRIQDITVITGLGLAVYFMKNMIMMYGPIKVHKKVVWAGEAKSNLQWPYDVMLELSQKGLPLLKTIYVKHIK